MAWANAEKRPSDPPDGRSGGRAPLSFRTRVSLAAGAAALVGVLAGIGVHLASTGSGAAQVDLALPAFHGQGLWEPGQRPAPPFRLRDLGGRPVSLGSQLGEPVLIAFVRARGDAGEGRALAQAEAILGDSPKPALDLISLEPDGAGPSQVRAATARWGLRAPYLWLSGSQAELHAVWHAYGLNQRTAPAGAGPMFLVDRAGFERAGYVYPFVPTVLAHDLRTLEVQAR